MYHKIIVPWRPWWLKCHSIPLTAILSGTGGSTTRSYDIRKFSVFVLPLKQQYITLTTTQCFEKQSLTLQVQTSHRTTILVKLGHILWRNCPLVSLWCPTTARPQLCDSVSFIFQSSGSWSELHNVALSFVCVFQRTLHSWSRHPPSVWLLPVLAIQQGRWFRMIEVFLLLWEPQTNFHSLPSFLVGDGNFWGISLKTWEIKLHEIKTKERKYFGL